MVEFVFRIAMSLLIMISSAQALTAVWTGQVSQDFSDTQNWGNSIPFVNSVMISDIGSQSPIIYAGTNITFGSGKDCFLGADDPGLLTMQGGNVSLDDFEVGGDYWSTGGDTGTFIMQAGTFTATDTWIGAGHNGDVIVNGGIFNAGDNLIIGGIGPHKGYVGPGSLVVNSGIVNAGSIDMAAGSTAQITFAGNGLVEASAINMRTNAQLNFVVNEDTNKPLVLTSTNLADYTIAGTIDTSFAGEALEGVYEIASFAADLTSVDFAGMISGTAQTQGWSLKIISDGNDGSILQAIYGVDCEALTLQGYRVVGDTNGDCVVDMVDFAALANNWQITDNPAVEHIGTSGAAGRTIATIASESILYTVPDTAIYTSTPGIAVCPGGRLVATFQVSGDDTVYNQIPEVAAGGRTFVYTSDDHGRSWQHRANVDILHARSFVAGEKLYILGQRGDLRISRSDDWGLTWSSHVLLTSGESWNGSAAGIWYKGDYVYLAMERYQYDESEAWAVAEFAPILLRGDITQNLLVASNWTLSTAGAYVDYFDDQTIDTLFGLPFYPAFYPDRYYFPNAGTRSFSPMGWLETNVVQIVDPYHNLYDPEEKTMHLIMRANTGLTNLACMLKVVEYADGSMRTRIQAAPSGKNLVYLALPGGQMRFHILYDDVTQLYWLLSTQSTDSMTQAQYLPADRFGGPENERRRLQLHFSKNLFDWCFAGLVAVGPTEIQSRHYASMAIDGDDLVILSRSGNENADSAHNTNMVTFHIIEGFRELVY